MKKWVRLAALVLGTALVGAVQAQVTGPEFTYIGKIKPRSSAEIRAAGLDSPFGVGGETTDRNFSTFSLWKDYLGPLGAMKVRVQSGWHDVEQVITPTPTYNFAKLDAIVDGSLAQGVKPFMFLGYGNERPGCTDCGTKGLAGALPSGVGLPRWTAFVTATVAHFNSPTVRVNDWQIWNEPDGHVDVNQYAALLVQTAKAIKKVQPNAKITIGSFTTGVIGGTSTTSFQYAKTALDYFAANKGPTVPAADVSVGFHPYWSPPDYDQYANEYLKVLAFKDLVESKGFKLRQDENGAPSTQCLYFALCGSAVWDEANQAKYDLRRMLGDFALGIESSIFTIVDLHYDSTKNTKGLLRTGTFDTTNDSPYTNGDQTIKGKKMAYGSYQNVTAIFDNRLTVVSNHGCTAPYGYKVQAYTRNDGGTVRNMLAVWNKIGELPKTTVMTPIAINCSNFHLSRLAQASLLPRVADLLDGRVYATTNATILSNNAAQNTLQVRNLPVGDYPVLLADQGIVLFQP